MLLVRGIKKMGAEQRRTTTVQGKSINEYSDTSNSRGLIADKLSFYCRPRLRFVKMLGLRTNRVSPRGICGRVRLAFSLQF